MIRRHGFSFRAPQHPKNDTAMMTTPTAMQRLAAFRNGKLGSKVANGPSRWCKKIPPPTRVAPEIWRKIVNSGIYNGKKEQTSWMYITIKTWVKFTWFTDWRFFFLMCIRTCIKGLSVERCVLNIILRIRIVWKFLIHNSNAKELYHANCYLEGIDDHTRSCFYYPPCLRLAEWVTL